jgi:hypothetical protein
MVVLSLAIRPSPQRTTPTQPRSAEARNRERTGRWPWNRRAPLSTLSSTKGTLLPIPRQERVSGALSGGPPPGRGHETTERDAEEGRQGEELHR